MTRALHRRSFLRVAGAAAASSALVLAGCGDDPDDPAPSTGTGTLSFGQNDTGILNYAYLLEQIEAAFYDKVVATPPADLRPGELDLLKDIRDHELIHREFLKYALGSNAYDNNQTALEFNFSSLTLGTRQGVWSAAQQFEDLGVAAYNGAAKLLSTSADTGLRYLTLLGKIASVEARHAAVAHEALQAGTFAAPVDAAGLDAAKTPAEVVAVIQPFVPVTISVVSLPTA